MRTVRIAELTPDDVFVCSHNHGDGTVTLYEDWSEVPVTPPTKPVVVITPRQFRQALTRAQLRQMVETLIANSEQDVKDWYEFATGFESTHPVVLQMAQAMGKTEADVDALFALGERL